MMGAHQFLAKCVMYQEAIRVPLMIRMPGQTQGTRVPGPVSQIDLVPTLLDLMEEPVHAPCQGTSLRPRMENPGGRAEAPVFVEWNGPNNGLGDLRGKTSIPDWMTEIGAAADIQAACIDPVRTVISADGWKLNCSPLGEHELYHLRDDPLETQNVFAHEQAIARELRRQILKWQAQTGDAVLLPDF